MSEASVIEVGANPADRARNRATGAGTVKDIYPHYDALRESGPVHGQSSFALIVLVPRARVPRGGALAVSWGRHP